MTGGFSPELTCPGLFSSVGSLVSDEIRMLTGGVPTLNTFTWFLSGVCYVVKCKLRLLMESLPTHTCGTYMRFLPSVDSLVLVQAKALTSDIHNISSLDGLSPVLLW